MLVESNRLRMSTPELGKEFRTYKIEKGQKKPLDLTWIQEAKYRLETPQERAEIKQARKSKLDIFGKFKKQKLKR
jgi:hypothetical protein